MQSSKIVTGLLILGGLLLILAGAMSLFAPETFTSRNGIDITGNVGLYNDYRGLGGILLGGGLTILAGAFVSSLSLTSTIMAVVIYLSFALGRLVSILADGVPVKGMVAATVVEGVLGLLALLVLSKYRKPIPAN